jgi:hypothetical protein
VPLIVAAVVAVIIVIAILGHLQVQKRKKDLAMWAGARGLSFSDAKDRGMDVRFPQFSCLRKGSDRYAFNIMEGTCNGRQVCAFDYRYVTHSSTSKGGSRSSTYRFSAVVVETNMPLKPLFIRTENLFDRLGGFLGFGDIDFELEEFNREFYVKADDRRWAFDVLQQATMEFLLGSPRFNLELDGTQVIAYRDSTFSPAEFGAALSVVGGVLDGLPGYLLREMKGVD